MTLGRRALMAAGYGLIIAVVICTPGSLQADDPVEVLVERQAVKPAILRIAIDRTIVFVNRSGKPVDVTFLGYRGMHHVSESSGQLTVVFHHAGRHPFRGHLLLERHAHVVVSHPSRHRFRKDLLQRLHRLA